MKKYLKRGSIVALIAAVLGTGGYFGKQYFDEHYILLNEEDMAAMEMNVAALMQRAFMMGQFSCEKST